eukprot:1189183-Prorocentrum_minimum.AAC.1
MRKKWSASLTHLEPVLSLNTLEAVYSPFANRMKSCPEHTAEAHSSTQRRFGRANGQCTL